MKYLATYLLAILGGVATPGADDIKKLLNSVNIESNDEEIAALLAAVEGKVCSMHHMLLSPCSIH